MTEPMGDRKVPRRIFRLTFTTGTGIRYWRYVRCPYQIKSPEDWGDSLEGMQKSLAELTLTGDIERFTISAVPADHTNAAAKRSLRWSEVRKLVA